MKHAQSQRNLAVGYLRVSTEEQRLGPLDQARALDQWAEREGATLVAIFFDFGVSGAKPAAKRPGLRAALGSLRDLRAGVLVAANRSRVGRSIEVVRAIEAETRRQGAILTTTDGMSDAAGSTGKLSRGLIDLVHEWERGVIAERVTAALAVKKRRGERIGQIPFGYELAADGLHLEPLEPEQCVLRVVRHLRSEGLSTRRIAATLEFQGHTSRSGKPFRQTQVVRMLRTGT